MKQDNTAEQLDFADVSDIQPASYKLVKTIKALNKELSNGMKSQLDEYSKLCKEIRAIIGELDVCIKTEGK